ncbi:MAG: Lrp/AsnC family transcriptional regulator [Desulfurococcales archaeon]|jgi:DNA-binding Lrp family transcriptional regulator|nr:Lrp/AsnC family transcriptional regulator [Desulfurococcales archaeon]
MSRKILSKEDLDKMILRIIQDNPKISLGELSRELGVPKATVYYRLKNLESLGYIKGYRAILNAEKLGFEYHTITLVRGRYGKDYHEILGEFLSTLPYVQSVYYVLGDIDFVVIAKSPNREEFMKLLNQMISNPYIERTSTMVAIKIYKEDPKLFI